MGLVTSTEMFKKAYDGGYAVGAFNVNNMEIVQAIAEAANELKSPVILQASAGARKYASQAYLMKLVEAAVEEERADEFDEQEEAHEDDHAAVLEILAHFLDEHRVSGFAEVFEEFLSDHGAFLLS